MASIKDVAAEVGVSVSTVSRAINHPDLVSPATRERILEAMRALGYSPNRLAQGLRKQTTGTIAVLVPDISNRFYTSVVRGIEDMVNDSGYCVMLCNTDENPEKEKSYFSMLSGRVDGLVLTPVIETDGSWENKSFLECPVVFLSRQIKHISIDLVKVDNELGAFQLVSHMIGMGFRRIAIISGPEHTTTGRERLLGYTAALESHQLEVDSSLIRFGNYTEGSGYRLAIDLVQSDPRPDALFVANDFMAVGALRALREAGIRVPDEMGIACFDEPQVSSLIEPRLTCVIQPAYELGRSAARLLMRRIQGKGGEPRKVVLPPKLQIGRSCREPQTD